jgi:transcriptional regulator with XRE-family HTH domain
MINEDANIGHRIKEKREELGLSIRELGRRTDLTASFISQIEHGRTNVSVGSLRRIAEALGVSIQYFFTEPPPDDPVIRSDNRPRISFAKSRVTYELLTPDRNRMLELLLGRLRPGSGNVARRLTKATEECIFVLSGSLQVGLTSGEYTLQAGDSIYFNGRDLQKLASSSDEETVWISAITPPAF